MDFFKTAIGDVSEKNFFSQKKKIILKNWICITKQLYTGFSDNNSFVLFSLQLRATDPVLSDCSN